MRIWPCDSRRRWPDWRSHAVIGERFAPRKLRFKGRRNFSRRMIRRPIARPRTLRCDPRCRQR